jgi:hypothetical protein
MRQALNNSAGKDRSMVNEIMLLSTGAPRRKIVKLFNVLKLIFVVVVVVGFPEEAVLWQW